jgi:hypothetical protein
MDKLSINTLNNTLNNIINNNNELLTIKELLNVINYDINNIYIDKFWDNIQNDKWIYIDDNMIDWMGFNRSEHKKNKQDYINILKENFEIHTEYELLNSIEFNTFLSAKNWRLENIEINQHNRVKHLILSPDCFKQSLLLLKTDKAKEIKKYYIKLEKLFKIYLQYQTKYQERKNKEIQQELNETKIEYNKQKEKIVDLSNHLFRYNELKENIYLYVATNKHLSL